MQGNRTSITNIPCFIALSPGRADSTLPGSIFFLVLWVLFPLEYVLLFYLIVDMVDPFGGLEGPGVGLPLYSPEWSVHHFLATANKNYL